MLPITGLPKEMPRQSAVQDQVAPRLDETGTMFSLIREELYNHFTAWQVRLAGL
jgi:hypothetical protein